MTELLFPTILIAFKEVLEMVLIIGAILLILKKTNETHLNKFVWKGVALGIVGSLAIGLILTGSIENLRNFTGELLEGITALLAAAVITYVIFWMHRHQKEIHGKVEHALGKKDHHERAYGLVFLSFLAILREGFEIVLLVAVTTGSFGFSGTTILGVLLGAAIAVALGFILFKTAVNLNLNLVFKVTAVFLALFAAGLLVTGLHELAETNVIPELPPVIDVTETLNHKTHFIGQMLNTLFGFRSKLNVLEIGAYLLYLIGIYLFYNRKK